MTSPTRMVGAAVLIAPLGVMALSMHMSDARAADIVDTLKEQQQFSTLVKAIESAGMAETLQGEGPFTVFAPTDEAFSQLPQGAVDELMEEDQAALKALIAQHVVEGKEITAKEVLGKQQKLTTLAGDTLTIDGINPTMLLAPTGLTITRIGERVIVQREGVAVPATSLEVQSTTVRRAGDSSEQPEAGQTGEQQTATSEQGDMPMSPHQQQVLKTDPAQQSTQTGTTGGMPKTEHQQQVTAGAPISSQQAAGAQPMQAQPDQQAQAAPTEEQQTATSEQGDMPMSPHQQQVLKTDPAQQSTQTGTTGGMPKTEHQQQVTAGAPTSPEQTAGAKPMPAQPDQQSQAAQTGEQQTATSEQGEMPMSPHQQQVLATDPAQQSAQTGGQGTAMPSSPHQRQVLAEPELAGKQKQYYQLERVEGLPDVLREAAVVEADLQADNGVIHAIDRVLVPPAALSTLESMPGQIGAVQQDPVSSAKSE